MQITIDNCVEVEQIAKDLILEDLLQNIGDCHETDTALNEFIQPINLLVILKYLKITRNYKIWCIFFNIILTKKVRNKGLPKLKST